MARRQGTPTKHKGIVRLDKDTFLVRVTARHPTTKRTKEKEETLAGVTMEQARRAQLGMLDTLQKLIVDEVAGRKARAAPRDMTLTAYAAHWLKHATATGRAREAFFKTRLPYLDRLVLPFFGDTLLTGFDEVAFSSWRDWLAVRSKDNGALYARTTLESVWGLLRMMLGDAKGLVGIDALGGRSFVWKAMGVKPKKKERLSREETGRVLDVLLLRGEVGWAAHLWTAALLGPRHSEVSALRIGRVDLEGGVLRIEESQVNGVFGETKSIDSRRALPMPIELRELLRRHLAELAASGRPTGVDDLLFPSDADTPRMVQAVNGKLAVVVAEAGVAKHITTHSFRHGLNDLVRKTSGDVAARGMLGHVTEEMTMNYSDVDMAEKADALAKALGQLPDPKTLVVQKRTPVVLQRQLTLTTEKLGMDVGDHGGDWGLAN